MPTPHSIRVVDSHTGGEPTRAVIEGGPDLGSGPISERVARFRATHDTFRSAIINEPRGSDVLVGALLVEPHEPGCATGVIFFNNVGYLGMCGHGTIGLVATLAHLGRIEVGVHRIDTSVGTVTATLNPDGSVSVENVASFRKAKDVAVTLDDGSVVTGDIAWGGNWFYLVEYLGGPLELADVCELTELAWRVRKAVNDQGFPEVDHVELLAKGAAPGTHARNFVLCPGRAYDRSPCGTGTSAKVACLAADGMLPEGATWVQEGILGSAFHARYRRSGAHILPTITGTAFVNAEATLLLNQRDPYCWGIRNL